MREEKEKAVVTRKRGRPTYHVLYLYAFHLLIVVPSFIISYVSYVNAKQRLQQRNRNLTEDRYKEKLLFLSSEQIFQMCTLVSCCKKLEIRNDPLQWEIKVEGSHFSIPFKVYDNSWYSLYYHFRQIESWFPTLSKHYQCSQQKISSSF